MDWDKNGYITPIEFRSYLEALKKGEEISQEEVIKAFNSIDKDGSKQIHWNEFLVRELAANRWKIRVYHFYHGYQWNYYTPARKRPNLSVCRTP